MSAPPSRTPRLLRMSYLVASIAGVGFFVMSVLLLGVWPGKVLEQQTRRMSPEHLLKLTASEQRGREIYSSEGCAYCHTQQVRYVESDMTRFGAPTLAWETQLDYPHLWGTRRIGPDLARESGSHPADWQLAHLFSPRAVVSDSVMPAYKMMFDGSPDRPRQEARDVVAYLETLGRARELAGPEGDERAQANCACPRDEMAQMAFHSDELNANPRKASRSGPVPPLTSGSLARGLELYAQDCASCHGTRGQGDGPGAAGLHPAPTNLAERYYFLPRLSFVLNNGVAGTAMPAWRDFPVYDISALAQAVRSFYTPQPEPKIPQEVLELGARIYTANCVQCHATDGSGKGTAVGELRVAPPDLRYQRPTLAETLRVLRNGVEGTDMAPWGLSPNGVGRLSEAELSAVAYYIRGFLDIQRRE